VLWTGVLLALGVVQATAGILRHRCAVVNWLSAAYRTVQVTVRHTGHLGATLPRRLSTGEVVSIGTSDISHIGNAIDITARASGSVVAVIEVAVILYITRRTRSPPGTEGSDPGRVEPDDAIVGVHG
jgi:hypothetical protein